MTIRLWKWRVVVLVAAALVNALRHSLESPDESPAVVEATSSTIPAHPA